jgi:hypothetical protein
VSAKMTRYDNLALRYQHWPKKRTSRSRLRPALTRLVFIPNLGIFAVKTYAKPFAPPQTCVLVISALLGTHRVPFECSLFR